MRMPRLLLYSNNGRACNEWTLLEAERGYESARTPKNTNTAVEVGLPTRTVEAASKRSFATRPF